ncbi:MAG: flavoprotein [Actinomycetia bacterium]|nr:flavoprotein [Actinomycetes bacterium]
MASFKPADPESDARRLAHLVVTAGIGAVDTIDRIKAEMDAGWDIEVIATPHAAAWLEASDLAQQILDLTGEPHRSTLRTPWDDKTERMANRCVAAPVTLNTLTKWADGHADNLALSTLCEATWTRGVPVDAHLTLNGPYAHHPAGKQAVELLTEHGVNIIPYVPGPAMKAVLATTYTPEQLPSALRKIVLDE